MRVGCQKSERPFLIWLLCAVVFSAGLSFWLDHYGARVLATVLNAEGKTTFGNRNEIDQNSRLLSAASHVAVGDELKTTRYGPITPREMRQRDGRRDEVASGYPRFE